MVPLARLTESVATWSPSREPDHEFDYIDLSAVDSTIKSVTRVTPMVGSEAPSRARQLVVAGDVLVSTVRPNLNAVAVIPPELDGATASTGFTVLRPGKELEGRFLFHWVRSGEFVAGMVRRATGASYPAVSDRIIKDSSIPLPPLPEQRRIAAILDHADALLAKRRQFLERLAELEQSIFLTMFGRDRELKSVSDLCDLVVDCVNRTAPVVARVTPYKMLRTTNIRNGLVDTSNVQYVEKDVFERWNRRASPRDGDVILTREAPVGEAAVFRGDDQVFLGQRLMLYRVDPAALTSDYLAACFRSPILQEQFHRLGSGSTVKHLPLPACRSFSIPVAPISDQRAFSERVAAIARLRARALAQSQSGAQLFASLQSRAFDGRL